MLGLFRPEGLVVSFQSKYRVLNYKCANLMKYGSKDLKDLHTVRNRQWHN